MAVNHKLTIVVKDRVIRNCQLNGADLSISFVDGSMMKVKIAESNRPTAPRGRANPPDFRGSGEAFIRV